NFWKYSKASRSSRATPSPLAYIRPSCHSAKPWPCSAAYFKEISARDFSPLFSASFALRIASTGDIARVGAAAAAAWACGASVGVTCGGCGVPSSASTDSTPSPDVNAKLSAMTLNVRIARLLGGSARVGDRAMQRVADLLGVFPDVACGDVLGTWLPGLA